MAKISPVAIKYMISAKFELDGVVEKPDVIGAIFGQTEGLLGSDLEMRDLQKEGKIGRIEVDLKSEKGKTTGTIQIPSALDKTETTLIAAAMETIERIGPSNAKIEIEKIEDVRQNKREYILERAKKLLENVEEKMPKTREIAYNLKVNSRMSKLKEYGKEKLPAGNLNSEEIIVVEGRADVINLLRNNIENVIGMSGTKLPEAIKELSYDKTVTLFIDGDRGGKLIAKNVIDNSRIDYIAFAPDGKEVEELSGKEILSSLRKKISVDEFSKKTGKRYIRKETIEKAAGISEKTAETSEEEVELDNEKLGKYLEQVENTKSAIILDKKLEIIDKKPVRGFFSTLSRMNGRAYLVIVDKATPSIVSAAEDNNIKTIVAKNFTSSSDKVDLISL